MRERPILFSGPMVRAILDGRKTVTRRVVRWNGPSDMRPLDIACPYGAPGDRLWVRETWAVGHHWDAWPPRMVPHVTRVHYRADDQPSGLLRNHSRVVWRPSIYMPRWASRITLEVVSVRVERLQEITEEDARAEGLDVETLGAIYRLGDGTPVARDAFGDVWDEINSRPGKRWEDDPWVWRVEFRRVT